MDLSKIEVSIIPYLFKAMKKYCGMLLFSLTFFVSTQAQSQPEDKWIEFTNALINDVPVTFLYNRSKITTMNVQNKSLIFYWIRAVPKYPATFIQQEPWHQHLYEKLQGYAYTESYYKANCENRMSLLLTQNLLNTKGALLLSFSKDRNKELESVTPDTIGEAELDAVCSKPSR